MEFVKIRVRSKYRPHVYENVMNYFKYHLKRASYKTKVTEIKNLMEWTEFSEYEMNWLREQLNDILTNHADCLV